MPEEIADGPREVFAYDIYPIEVNLMILDKKWNERSTRIKRQAT